MSCAWPGCTTPAAAWCKPHYDQLPANIQTALVRSFVKGAAEQSTGYRRAEDEALRWIQVTFDGGPVRERYEPAVWERLVRHVRDRDAARARRRGAFGPRDRLAAAHINGEQLELGLAKPEPWTPPTRCLP